MLRQQLCLDRDLFTQYAIWMIGDFTGNCPMRGNGILRGDFGNSFFHRQPVLDLYLLRIPATLQLTSYALVIGGAIGLFLGIVSAIYRGGVIDNVSRFFSVVFDALPQFWFGIILIMFFGVRLRWLPTGGMVPLNVDDPTIIDRIRHLILPSFVLGGDLDRTDVPLYAGRDARGDESGLHSNRTCQGVDLA